MKRKRQDQEEIANVQRNHLTPRRNREAPASNINGPGSETEAEAVADPPTPLETPTRPRRGRPPGSHQKQKSTPNVADSRADSRTPLKTKRKPLFSTPVKENGVSEDAVNGGPIVRNADRSARRKSARTLIQPTAIDALSDEDELEQGDLLARKIWEADEEGSGEEEVEVEDDLGDETAATPSKGRRGRRKKSPSPPQNLPPPERYFWQNRPGKVKTSNNTLASLSLLTHEQ